MADSLPQSIAGAVHTLSPLLLTPLVGREQELTALVEQLQQPAVRLLTLTGPPGVGKTRLALQAATALQAHFADGVFVVDLAALSDPGLVMATIAQSLGLRQEGERSFETRLYDYCQNRQLLLLLDNCERLTAAAPALLNLLTQAPRLKLMVTSRVRLHLRIEHEFPLSPLHLPDLKVADQTQWMQNPAVMLFVQRAQLAKPGFALTPQTCAVIANICHRLDGLPLALELAAARTKLLSPAVLLTRLTTARFQLLSGGAQDYPARQQTLRDTLTWSYTLLEPIQQRLLRRLAIFAGGCTIEAAETMANWPADEAGDGFAALTGLLDHHLLYTVAPQTGAPLTGAPPSMAAQEATPRVTMLESIRDYAWEKLTDAGEEDAAHEQHARLALALAETAEKALLGPEQQQWLDRLESEHDNLRSALQWSLPRSADDTALRIAAALWRFWFARGYMGEGLQWLQRVLESGAAEASATRAHAAGGAAILAAYLGHYQQAAQAAEISLALCRQLAFPPGVSAALNGLAFVAGMVGEHNRAHTLTQESVTIGRAASAPEVLAQALYYQALTAWLAGAYALAQEAIEEGLHLCQQQGDSRTEASFLYGRGLVTVAQQRYDQARPSFEQSLSTLRQLGDKRSVTMCLAGLADVALSRQETERARDYIDEALLLSYEVGDRWFAAYTVDGLAAAATMEGQVSDAARFFAAADAMRTAIGAATPAARQSVRTAALQTIQRHLDQPTFAAVWAEGERLTLEEILAQPRLIHTAVNPPPSPPERSASAFPLVSLTRREREVLRLVTQGLTDAQIAESLVISPHTVHTHLSTIYSKLGVSSRTAAAHIAVQQQLV
ncbi:MAG: LuxR C-terminal-related transcriptional regulator [Caldilineaceae bacterium]